MSIKGSYVLLLTMVSSQSEQKAGLEIQFREEGIADSTISAESQHLLLLLPLPPGTDGLVLKETAFKIVASPAIL